jgi:hypothetical protein
MRQAGMGDALRAEQSRLRGICRAVGSAESHDEARWNCAPKGNPCWARGIATIQQDCTKKELEVLSAVPLFRVRRTVMYYPSTKSPPKMREELPGANQAPDRADHLQRPHGSGLLGVERTRCCGCAASVLGARLADPALRNISTKGNATPLGVAFLQCGSEQEALSPERVT